MSMSQPTEIILHQQTRSLEIAYSDGARHTLTAEFLRVFSPSAEVRGHGPGQETLQVGKQLVNITELEPVGQYAMKIHYDDGHDSGIYSWDYLYGLGLDQEILWHNYLSRLKKAGASRMPKE